VRDLAYVSTIRDKDRTVEALSVLLSNQNGCFRSPPAPAVGQPPTLVGENPSLIAAGKFDGDKNEDIVIGNGLDQFNRSARLRIFRGKGQGHFTPMSPFFPLQANEVPVAMAIGHFRSSSMPNKPIDLAIVSSKGILNILFNKGNGEFEPSQPISLGNFGPEAIVASDRFRDGGNTDLVIRGRSAIMFLKNSGSGTFPNRQVIAGAGNVPTLLLGVLDPNDAMGNKAGDKLDIITFDRDMTLKVFVNDGSGAFNPPQSLLWKGGENIKKENFSFVDADIGHQDNTDSKGSQFARFFVANSGDCTETHSSTSPSSCEPFRLKAVTIRGILTLESNNDGISVRPTLKPFAFALPSLPLVVKKADLIRSDGRHHSLRLRAHAGVADQFMASGGVLLPPALALITNFVEKTIIDRNCRGIQPVAGPIEGLLRPVAAHSLTRYPTLHACMEECSCGFGEKPFCEGHSSEGWYCDCIEQPLPPPACEITKELSTPVMLVFDIR
jgi:hypothetical protein